MKITAQLKAWLVERNKLSAGAADDDICKAAAVALVDGSLSAELFKTLTIDEEAKMATTLADTLKTLTDTVKGMQDQIAEMKAKPATQEKPAASAFEKAIATAETRIYVVGAHERYSKSKAELRYPERDVRNLKHRWAGQPVMQFGTAMQSSSELDKAVIGVTFKSICSGKGGPRLNEHDNELLKHALENYEWCGNVRGESDDIKGRLSPWQQKALIDDSTSGGLEAVPIVFDDAVIQTPLLYGELYPRVNVVNLTRGRRVEGVTISNVTGSSGGADNTSIPLFSTASFIAAFDTTVFTWNGAIEIGLDFLADAPVDVAGIVTETYGRSLLNWLDNQIANGDGTTEPEGVFVASGTTSVNAANGATGPWTVGDIENLLFGVTKQYKQGYAIDRISYLANETAYHRMRAISIGTTDARRVFGMDQESYSVFGHPFAIQGDIGNRRCAFVNFARYRMYRRLGLDVKATSEGQTLVRKNLMMVSARARFGGQLEDGAAAAVCTDGQS